MKPQSLDHRNNDQDKAPGHVWPIYEHMQGREKSMTGVLEFWWNGLGIFNTVADLLELITGVIL